MVALRATNEVEKVVTLELAPCTITEPSDIVELALLTVKVGRPMAFVVLLVSPSKLCLGPWVHAASVGVWLVPKPMLTRGLVGTSPMVLATSIAIEGTPTPETCPGPRPRTKATQVLHDECENVLHHSLYETHARSRIWSGIGVVHLNRHAEAIGVVHEHKQETYTRAPGPSPYQELRKNESHE